MLTKPELSRTLDPAVDLNRNPITNAERLFVLFLILHLASSFEATKHGMYFAERGLRADVRAFFNLPIPGMVWEEVKVYQDFDFVRFVEEADRVSSLEDTTTDPLGHTITNNYVPTGKTSSWITTSSLPFYTTLPSTKKTTFYYDANWRKTRVQQAPGTADEANTYFTYDNLGNQLTTQDPRGNFTTNVYDARNRLTSSTDALSHATSFTYDAHSNKLTTTKANGEVVTNVYDKLNRVIQVRTTRDANTTDVRNVAYDAAGNQIKLQDENATARSDTVNIYTYTYDLRNRITSMIYPNALHEDTSYDNVGNTVTYKNRAGAIKTFSQFDVRNRAHRFDWNDGITPWQSTSYDDASRITQIANSVSTINNTYLNDNHLSTHEEWTSAFSDNVHRTVTYTYDVDGNRLTVQYPSGTAFNYTYTNRNQVTSIKPGLSGGTAVVSYTFDASGNITNRALDNGTSTAYTVDQVDRDTAVVHNLQPSGTTKRFDYAYNSVNDVLAVQRDSGLGDGYTYDLTQEILGYAQNGTVNLTNGTISSPAVDTNLTFDGCGNQTSLNGGGTFAVDYLNEYTTFNGQALTSDNDGDVLTYNGWTYVYDAQNRLLSATLSGTTIATFYYDGLNRQVARSINGVITFSVWDGDWAVLEEYGTSNTITQKYLQGYHGLVKTLQDNIYYYQDELGSTSHIANASGALQEYYKYDLYGKPTYWSAANSQISSSNYNVRDLFTGQRWIVEIGLYDDRNRFMSPALGRFIQPDPIGFKGDGSNLYRYCGNDWANRSDPMGLIESTVPLSSNPKWVSLQHQDSDRERGALMGQMINVQRINVRSEQDKTMGFTMGGTPSARVYGEGAGGRQVGQKSESYRAEQLTHGSDPRKMTLDRANAAYLKTKEDKQEWHSYILQNPKNSKDFVETPLHPGGVEGTKNYTDIGNFARVGDYKRWGVGMSEYRYDMQMINRDLGIFRDHNINGVIMSPPAPSGMASAPQPPFTTW